MLDTARPVADATVRSPSPLDNTALLLAAVLDNTTAGIFLLDDRQYCVYMNRAAEELTGFTLAEVRGGPLHDYIHHSHPDGRHFPAEECPIDRAFPTRMQEQGEEVFVRKDGTFYPVAFTASPVHDKAARVVGTVIEVRDITEERQAAQKLVQGEEQYRTIFTASPVPMWVFDSETLRFLEVNEAAVLHYGYTRDDFLSMTIADIRPAEDLPHLRAHLDSNPARHSSDGIWRHRKKDGSLINVEITSHGVQFTGHRARIVMVNDVTVRQRAEYALRKSEERLQLATRGAEVGVWEVDLQSGTGYWSRESVALIGSTRNSFTGADWLEAVHPDDRRMAAAAWQLAIDADVPYAVEFRAATPGPDGTERVLMSRGQVKRDARGAPLSGVGILMDITARRRSEAALQDADRRKDEFLATLAHELRNPLAPVRNSLALLRIAGNDPAVRDRAVDMMNRQVDHMVRLVDDLLEVSRITRGKIELRKEPVDLRAAVGAAVETVTPLLEAAGHGLSVLLPSESLVIDADPFRLSQVISNLLNNAVKYTEFGGSIVLEARREDGWAVISVRDSGVGIPPEMLPRVFELFTQVDHTLGRSQGGLGIGLALVKQLVAMHGGEVLAASEGIGKGSEFRVRLPLASMREVRAPRAEDGRLAAVETPLRVLVVDDNEDAAESLQMLLTLLGNEVKAVFDGFAAEAVVSDFRPEVVLLDIGLPGRDGYEVARRLRVQPGGDAILLVAVTGWGQAEDRRKSASAGFDAHVIKPVDPDAVAQLLASYRRARAPLTSPMAGDWKAFPTGKREMPFS
jgi:PAS domain S-box-containing protein